MDYGTFIGIIIDELEKIYKEIFFVEGYKLNNSNNNPESDMVHQNEVKLGKLVINDNKRKSNKLFFTLEEYTNGEYLSFHKQILYYYYNQNEKIIIHI